MKKIIALCLVLTVALALFAGCSKSKPALEGTPAEIIEKIYAQHPMEMALATISPDDPETSGMWDWNYHAGLTDGSKVASAAVSEALIGSIPYSLLVVRVANAADAKAVGEEIKDNINTRKWICVEAGDMLVAGYGDVVMMVMINEEHGSAQAIVDAFKTVCGAELDFVL